jgi:glycopeptide antibiotics resistance protein
LIATLLVEHRWVAPTVLVLAVLCGPLMGTWLVSRTRIAWALTGAALLPLVLLTLVPQDRQLFARCTVLWEIPRLTAPEPLANILLFVAPVLFAGVATRKPLWVMLAGSVLSAAVEALQAAVPAIGRSCDSGDWVSNTTGAVIGAVMAILSLALASHRSKRASSSPAEVDA